MKKNAWPTDSGWVNERPMDSEKIGSRSSRRAPSTATSWPWTSQAMTRPVQPQNSSTPSSRTPVTQARARAPQVRPAANILIAWRATATIARSAL